MLDQALGTYEDSIKLFISGKVDIPTWNSTDIPYLWESPNLLLHQLGQPGEEMEQRIDNVFHRNQMLSVLNEFYSPVSILTVVTRLFINTSGSGKTRILLEGLCRNWGFYFVCTKGSTRSPGSEDLSHTIEKMRERSGFCEKVDPMDHNADRQNRSIAQRYLRNVLLARMLLFDLFLRHSRHLDILKRQKCWLMMQVLPEFTLTADIFKVLTEVLGSLPEAFLSSKVYNIWNEVLMSVDGFISFVIDDAQHAATTLPNAFLSSNGSDYCPILRVLISTWVHGLQLCRSKQIISGTGINPELVQSFVTSGPAKSAGISICIRTGSFDSRPDQEAYITRYLWPDKKAHNRSPQHLTFIRNAWQWLRGRYLPFFSDLE
jgi:hypothetical protein